MNALRAKLDAPHTDPETLHDEVRALLEDLRRHREDAPADLREALDALEAEIIEDLHDNLPI
jgi:hypothetical protein